MKQFFVLTVMAAATVAFAASPQDFSEAAVESAGNAKTPEGKTYSMKFIQFVRKPFSDAMEKCYNDPIESDSRYDAVFVISLSGRVERTFGGPSNSFAECIGANLRLPKNLPQPPKQHWALRVQVVHGQVRDGEADPLVLIFVDDAGASPKEATGAVVDYTKQAIAIEENAVGAAVKGHPERLGNNRITTKYEIEESGQIRDLKITAEKPNQWAEETIRRAVSKIEFPPVPKEVSRETGIVIIENVFVFK